MRLWETLYKKVRLVCTDGDVFEGVVNTYISAPDNEPEEESICIGNIEFMAHEIKSVEILE